MSEPTRRLKTLPTHLALVVTCLILMVPLYWMVVTAVKPLQEALASPPTLWPHHVAFSNFADALRQAPFVRYVANTVLTAGLTAVGNVVIGSLAGYALARGRFRGRGVLLGFVLASVMVPGEATFIPNYVTIRNLGWYDSYLALVAPWLVGAFSVFLYRQAFRSLPESLFEAARLDGCSELRLFRAVAFPLVRATSLTVFVLSFVWTWNAFLWPLLVTSRPELRVLQLGLTAFQTEGGVYVNLLMAATVLSVVPVLVLFATTQRLVISGIGEGALK
ncbi:ABC-type glycerol-3-phosphate transport system permease component [Kribbella aluminosa]|uniref:ABC-type glycerol-3-phosphate transport system permease component n=1 Tax=Kribbella aluminosa TaxID=416017 RepID=A0ABS4UIV5_9ACTN|nr:carbohydrate ABC transporter permease [Kribbella aluminosa]MBP2351587.1 ABC-type glycerol-3-phosphate transport system permease component [Kribbella aluminosa]